ncbi:phospholipase A [Microbulbifer magnicolonia]|uniref:phospholipase A n=1 Tax=Microbulbifer magnicolonia TaxID=3109744 RepID=UPI002B410A4F|nr:phospholipase A [Microbulbifer sp. GG15]
MSLISAPLLAVGQESLRQVVVPVEQSSREIARDAASPSEQIPAGVLVIAALPESSEAAGDAGRAASEPGLPDPPTSAPSDRVRAVQDAAGNRFSLASHKASYVLPAAYYAGEGDAEGTSGVSADLKPIEIEFQLSVQVPVWTGLLGPSSFLSAAYTNHSFWQAYTPSAPFRESIHEPEVLLTWLSDWELLGFECAATQLAFSHQSNGLEGEQSRGWNRIYAHFIFERDQYFLAFKPWYRIPEDGVGDDNPDLGFYLGHFEFSGGFRGDRFGASMMLRNNLRSDNRGALELRWSFPVGQRLRGVVRYFNGYGHGLLSYDRRQQSLGMGIELAEGF